ncbi:MAG TPA: acyltransferase family protein [Chitinophagaceae bacterium]|nr:acyltransferase family protein [Chitinophagaceae bacterium]
MTNAATKRNFGLDLLRVIACYMVVQIHTGEFYYIGPQGEVLHTANAQWVGWLNSLFRSCVPLFVMISGFFLFPISDTRQFFKKRLTRVAIPFIIWCALYAVYFYLTGQSTFTEALKNILKIPVNFGTEIGHLWFVYMLIGIYLFAPLISQWVQTASRANMQLYLVLWGIALSVPYIHLIFPEILGECYWNHTPLLYYFSGFLGYVILANYIKRFYMQPAAWNYTAGILLIIAGYAITAYGFLHRLPTENVVMNVEVTWGFESINVAMITAGIFIMVKNIHTSSSTGVTKFITDISAKSYGMYLAHIMLLRTIFPFIDPHFASAAIKVPLIAVTTFFSTYLVIKCLSYLPKSKLFIG